MIRGAERASHHGGALYPVQESPPLLVAIVERVPAGDAVSVGA